MVIDCDACAARGPACSRCLVGAILDLPSGPVRLDPAELRAVRVLADAGLIEPLRLVTLARPAAPEQPAESGDTRPGPASGAGRPVRRAA